MDCLFCSIISGEIPSKIAYEDDDILAFHDIKPQAPVHVLVISKKHISGMNEITPENADVVSKIFVKIPEIAKKLGIDKSGFRVISNCGDDADQSVKHLHFHVLGGKKLAVKLS
jgi:histidine triad (HIT) family protein